MNALTINECCAICEKHRKADCRLFKLFKAAEFGNYDNDDIQEDSLVMVCKEFKPNKSLETYTPWTIEPHNPNYVPNPIYTDGRHCKTMDDCTNPHYDCINCPLRNGGSSITTNGNDFIINTIGTFMGRRDFEEKETTTGEGE